MSSCFVQRDVSGLCRVEVVAGLELGLVDEGVVSRLPGSDSGRELVREGRSVIGMI